MQSQHFFGSPRAASLVLAHVREFKRWWGLGRSCDSVQHLFSRPIDWPDLPPTALLDPLMRLRLPAGGFGWLGHVRSWRTCADAAVWKDANFLITPDHDGETVTCDVFSVGRTLGPATVAHIAHLLSDTGPSASSFGYTDVAKHSDAAGRFGIRLLSLVVREGLQAVVVPCHTHTDEAWSAQLHRSPVRAALSVQEFRKLIGDERRQIELDALHDALNDEPVASGSWLVFVGAVKLLELSSGREVHELDGLWAHIQPDGISWTVLERKDAQRGSGRAQLKSLAQSLTVPLSPVSASRSRGGSSATCTFRWPNSAEADPPL